MEAVLSVQATSSANFPVPASIDPGGDAMVLLHDEAPSVTADPENASNTTADARRPNDLDSISSR